MDWNASSMDELWGWQTTSAPSLSFRLTLTLAFCYECSRVQWSYFDRILHTHTCTHIYNTYNDINVLHFLNIFSKLKDIHDGHESFGMPGLTPAFLQLKSPFRSFSVSRMHTHTTIYIYTYIYKRRLRWFVVNCVFLDGRDCHFTISHYPVRMLYTHSFHAIEDVPFFLFHALFCPTSLFFLCKSFTFFYV